MSFLSTWNNSLGDFQVILRSNSDWVKNTCDDHMVVLADSNDSLISTPFNFIIKIHSFLHDSQMKSNSIIKGRQFYSLPILSLLYTLFFSSFTSFFPLFFLSFFLWLHSFLYLFSLFFLCFFLSFYYLLFIIYLFLSCLPFPFVSFTSFPLFFSDFSLSLVFQSLETHSVASEVHMVP